MILHCTCNHQYQDSEYGASNRVCNKLGPKKPPGTYRCTVCGRETQTSKAETKQKLDKKETKNV